MTAQQAKMVRTGMRKLRTVCQATQNVYGEHGVGTMAYFWIKKKDKIIGKIYTDLFKKYIKNTVSFGCQIYLE